MAAPHPGGLAASAEAGKRVRRMDRVPPVCQLDNARAETHVHPPMTNPILPSSLLTPLISSDAMRTVLSDKARLQRMLDVEVAVIRAQVAVGVIPALATDKIADVAKAERFDLAAIGTDA